MSTFDQDDNNDWETTTLEFENNDGYASDQQQHDDDNDNDNDDDNESDYSLDYEFSGPRYANYRPTNDDDNDQASDLSESEHDQDTPRFDMWDDDPYNDFTWESNDMQLTKFMKRKKRELTTQSSSFWKKEKGWPRQLPYSCSSTNHDQSANAICLVQSNYGLSEQLYAVYRDRIIQCGKSPVQKNLNKPSKAILKQEQLKRDTTWLDRSNECNNSSNSSNSSNNSNNKFVDTHQSVSLSKLYNNSTIQQQQQHHDKERQLLTSENYNSKFKPYAKYIKRIDYPGLLQKDAYLPLGFDPQCLAQKYGYMAIGGVEGEFELYCCMDPDNPVKIWGTKFKGKDNVMLMTNAIQLVRWKNKSSGEYEHMLIGCMNEAGLLFYHLPPHSECKDFHGQQQQQQSVIVKLHSHLRSFNGVPINDAKLSPDGTKLVCVGDDNIIFMIDVYHCTTTVTFSTPIEIIIPPQIFLQKSMLTTPYSSQYVAWSPSSKYFAHTSDSHNLVLVWRTCTREILYTIDAAGYTYAISFHPHLDNILVFTNRYGYFHTVDLSMATYKNTTINILTFDHQTESSRGHTCVDTCIQDNNHAVFHTRHLKIQHEITMVSFRGQMNTRLRILAKINGIEWSKDGRYLYVATKKRVLAFQFLQTQQHIPTLLDITGVHVRKLLEQQEERSRKRKKLNNKTLNDWSLFIPDYVQSRILGDTQQLACHW